MKKIVSLLLALILALSIPFGSFAAEKPPAPEYDGYPLILIRGMDFNGLYYKLGTSEEQRCFKGIEAGPLLKALGLSIFKGFTKFSIEAFFEEVCVYLTDIMGLIACSEDGSSKYDVSVNEYPLSLANYLEYKEWGTFNEMGILASACEKYGAENVYYFNYDWRIDPFINAERLNEMVIQAKKDSGKDKVNLVCCSMGGIESVSYMYKYGTQDLNRVIFLSSTVTGTHVTSDVLRGLVEITPNNLYRFVSQSLAPDNEFVQLLIKGFYKAKVFDVLCNAVNKIIDKGLDTVYDNFLLNTFGTMPAIWALVLPEYYDEAIKYVFAGKEDKYSDFIALTKEYQKMASERDGMLKDAAENGVSICFVAGYDRCCVPVYTGGECNGDGTLEADRMLGGAVVSALNSTLGDDYVPAEPSRLSPDRKVDLSGVLFPESTWAVRNLNHVGCSTNTDSSDFLFWLLGYDGNVTVSSNPEYPQFMVSSDGYKLAPQK
ncbi:MAG: hypothetical protein MJ173_00305 [Clostridia bacterium]|nr:hypothetical protein [Clostridia bacterium]